MWLIKSALSLVARVKRASNYLFISLDKSAATGKPGLVNSRKFATLTNGYLLGIVGRVMANLEVSQAFPTRFWDDDALTGVRIRPGPEAS